MGRRPDIDGRELLLEAALKLFAEQGIDGVSIRAVNREAGLGPASVHYHFGTKEALLDAVLHTYGDVVVDRIKARAAELVRPGSQPTARDIVSMVVEPYLDLISSQDEHGQAWVRLMSQLLRQDADRLLDRSSSRLTRAAAARAYPNASEGNILRAIRMCMILLITHLAQAPRRGRAPLDMDLLIDFLSAGLDAVLGSEGRAIA